MRRYPIVVSLLISAGAALAQDPPRIAQYVPAAPDPRHVFVMDSAHVLSDATIRALQDSAQALQVETGADIAWVTLPTLGGRAIEEATDYLGRTWKVGSAGAPGDPLRNRGLVILYIPNKSTTAGSNFRVEVGKGLQGTIIDSRSRAISAAMRDDLRAKRFDAGYMKGWAVAAAMVREDFASRGSPVRAVPQPSFDAVNSAELQSHHVGIGAKLVAAVVLIGFILLFIALIRTRSRNVGLAGGGFLPLPLDDADDDDSRRRRDDSSSSSSDSSSDSGSSDSGGGDFGGGGGFDGGGSSDSI
jgi:uncharacterized protein